MDMQNNEYLIKLNEHLTMLRAQSGMKQSELADVCGIARTTYSAIENKKRKMTFPVFISLSKYFISNEKTKSVMELLGLTEDVLNHFFQIEALINTIPKQTEIKKVAAFGGNVDDESDDVMQRKIEKAIKGIDD